MICDLIVNIDCKDTNLRNGLNELRSEILLIGKSSLINFDDAQKSSPGRTFKFELSDTCSLNVNFQVN